MHPFAAAAGYGVLSADTVTAVLVDGHVHLYPEFDPARFVVAAATNLAAAAHAAGIGPDRTANVLLLVETPRETGFADLRDGSLVLSGWRAEAAALGDPAVILTPETGGQPLILVAGRQIQTAERIEVLAFATTAAPPADGTSLDEVLAALATQGVPAVLPWGAGKWIGRRGRRVRAALAAHPGVLLGDNAGRPIGWPSPKIFDRAPVLPGSDPLPYPGAEAGVGRYGFLLEGPIDLARPGAAIRDALLGLTATPRRVGRRVGPLGFIVGQTRMRLARWSRKGNV